MSDGTKGNLLVIGTDAAQTKRANWIRGTASENQESESKRCRPQLQGAERSLKAGPEAISSNQKVAISSAEKRQRRD